MEYVISGKTYEQNKLVWGQVKQLVNIVKGIEFRSGMSAAELIEILGDKMPFLLAVVLTEKGSSMKDKNIEQFASELAFSIEVDDVLKVVEDFFDCNPTASYLNKISDLVGKMTNEVTKASTT